MPAEIAWNQPDNRRRDISGVIPFDDLEAAWSEARCSDREPEYESSYRVMTNSADLPWWKRTTVYQIYPRSFADDNGDGIGDLCGIIGKLDYLQSLGVETLWLSPFFASPQADFGYDISDHFAVAPEYGTIDDVRRLIREVHARGMKIVLDMVLNHTSEKHPWFIASKSSRENSKRDYYIWRDGRKPRGKSPPNNWRSMLGGSGWRYDEITEQWYFASFLGFQPDLNYRNPEVKRAMLGVVRHWLAEGVDGLRLDIFNALFKDPSFSDNPFSWRPFPSDENPNGYFQRHVYSLDHPDTIAFAKELRQVTDAFVDPPRFLVGEVFGKAENLRRYCGENANGLHLVFLFEALTVGLDAPSIRALIDGFEHAFPEPFSPTWVLGNHDRPRSSYRAGGDLDKEKLLATLQLTARGVPFIYYGEELGMKNRDIPLSQGLDPIAARFRGTPRWVVRYLRGRGVLMNRDECRSPMQWTSEPHAGFTAPSATPWLGIDCNSATINVARQANDPTSLLAWYKVLLSLRRSNASLSAGSFHWLPEKSPNLLLYRRAFENERVDIALNPSGREVHLEIADHHRRDVVLSASAQRRPASSSETLGPYQTLLILDR